MYYIFFIHSSVGHFDCFHVFAIINSSAMNIEALQWYMQASLVVQLVKNPREMQEILVQSLGKEDPLEKQ